MGHDDDDAQRTQATRLPTLPPVERKAGLPRAAEDGSMCFVKDRGESFVFVDGEWKPLKQVQA